MKQFIWKHIITKLFKEYIDALIWTVDTKARFGSIKNYHKLMQEEFEQEEKTFKDEGNFY